MTSRRLIGLSIAVCLAGFPLLAAEERPDEAVFWKIRQEATARSQILQTVHVLTDVYGPRLTGSPNLKAAGEWAIQQMTSWGLQNGHLEPWDFGHDGWANERVTAHMVSPAQDALVVEVLAWTPGTNGVARGQAVQITLPARPTAAEMTSFLEGIKSTVSGRTYLHHFALNFSHAGAGSARLMPALMSSIMRAPIQPPLARGVPAQPGARETPRRTASRQVACP